MQAHKLFLILTLAFAPVNILADDTPEFDPSVLTPGNKNQKKHLPSRERIYYYYDGTQLEFEPNFEYSALYVTVEDENTHRVWTGTATPDAPTVSAPDVPGSYVITTVTDQGKTFSGYFDL